MLLKEGRKDLESSPRMNQRFGKCSVETFLMDYFQPKKIALNSGINSVVLDEKMKARQERFKIQ